MPMIHTIDWREAKKKTTEKKCCNWNNENYAGLWFKRKLHRFNGFQLNRFYPPLNIKQTKCAIQSCWTIGQSMHCVTVLFNGCQPASEWARGNSVHTLKLCVAWLAWTIECVCVSSLHAKLQWNLSTQIRSVYIERDAFRCDEILFDSNTSYLIWFDLVSAAMSIFMHTTKMAFAPFNVCACVCVWLVQDFISANPQKFP